MDLKVMSSCSYHLAEAAWTAKVGDKCRHFELF